MDKKNLLLNDIQIKHYLALSKEIMANELSTNNFESILAVMCSQFVANKACLKNKEYTLKDIHDYKRQFIRTFEIAVDGVIRSFKAGSYIKLKGNEGEASC
jgi:hypothetical protein